MPARRPERKSSALPRGSRQPQSLTFTTDSAYNGPMERTGGLDVAALQAIDVHVHIEVDLHGHLALPDDQARAAAQYFGADAKRPTLPEIAAHYRERSIGAVVFTVDT